jgi:hypothetical protein
MTKENMNINLSETEIQALLVALKHTQRFQDEDAEADEDAVNSSPGTQAWLKRKFAAEDLSEKLSSALQTHEAKPQRLMRGTADPCCDPEALCANDPVKW